MSVDNLHLDLASNTYTIITGDNASGKSSLLEAISMALIERRKGDSYRDYVQTGKKKATIDMNVVLEGKDLRIVIEINNNKYGVPVKRTIYLGDEIYNNSDCTKLLKTFNVKYLQHITFFHQKDSSILELRPTEVSSLLKELFDIDYSAQVNILSQSIVTMEESDVSLQSKLKTLENFLSNLKEVDLLPDPRREIQETVFNIQAKEKNLKNYEDLKNKVTKLSELKKSFNSSEEELEDLVSRKTKLVESKASSTLKITEVEKEIFTTKQVAALPITDGEILKLEKNKKDLQREIQINRDLLPEKRSEIKRLTHEINAYRNGVCPVCEQDLSAEKEKIDSLESDISDQETLLQSLEDFISVKGKEHNELGTSYSLKTKEYNLLKKKIDQAKVSLPHLQKSLLDVKDNLKMGDKHLQYSEKRIEIIEKEIEEYLGKINAIHVLANEVSEINTLNKELGQFKDRLGMLERNKVINEERNLSNAKVKKDQKDLSKEIDEVKKEVHRLAKKIQSDKEAVNILSTEFPNYVILQKTSQLEDSINDIIQRIFPGMVVKLTLKRSGISFYYSPEGDEHYLPAKMASGAQSAVLMLAWRVALAEMYGIDTLILDEIDADANDANSSIIYEFIGSLTTFDQIIIISHRKASIKTVKDLNENVQSFWVEKGVYLSESPELNV